MKLRAAWGELLLCLAFAGAGLFWVAIALRMQLWDGFAPASGFLPLIYGVLLIVLATLATIVDVLGGRDASAELPGPVGRPLLVLAALAAGVAGIELIGFCASMFLAMLFLFRVAEKRSMTASLATSAGSALVLVLIFRNWLGVPMPVGPWGF
jgi:putative tricarboxylic transport membrane protein